MKRIQLPQAESDRWREMIASGEAVRLTNKNIEEHKREIQRRLSTDDRQDGTDD